MFLGFCFLCAPLLVWAPRVVSGLTARSARGRRPASLMVLLVVPRVFRAPEGPAAREARRPHFVRRRASKPARALRSLRRPPHQWGWSLFGSSTRRLKARPGPAAAHRHRDQSPPPPTSTAAWHLLGPRRSPPALRPSPSLPSFLNPHPISHAIPPRLFQTLNSDRWNCNISGLY